MKQNKQKDTYTVFSLQVAGKLCKKVSWLDVYDLKYSPELEEAKYQ